MEGSVSCMNARHGQDEGSVEKHVCAALSPRALAPAPRCFRVWQQIKCSPWHMPSAVRLAKRREAKCLSVFLIKSWVRDKRSSIMVSFTEVYKRKWCEPDILPSVQACVQRSISDSILGASSLHHHFGLAHEAHQSMYSRITLPLTSSETSPSLSFLICK